MAKFQMQSKSPKKEALVSHDIVLPESAHGAIREDAAKTIQIRFSPETLKKTNQIVDSLLISRKILKPETINQNNPHVMLLSMVDKERPIADVIYEVQYYHGVWAEEVKRDAGFIALTLMTKLKDVDPLPYKPEDFEDEREDWEGTASALPVPERLFSNPYERRLKQFLDMLDLTDLQFQIMVGQKLNDVFIDALRTYGVGEVDEAKFQPAAAGRGGDVSSVATAAS